MKRAFLLRLGRRLMHRYIAAVEALSHHVTARGIAEAETVCPSLKRLRRRGKACARLARRAG